MTLIDSLKQIPDHRHRRGQRHPLWMLLMMSVLGFLCGYRGYRPLADFVTRHEGDLRDLLGLAETQSMPSYSTFRRTSLAVDSQGWVEAFNAWAIATLPLAVGALMSVDGKSLRCTSTGGQTAEQNFTTLVSLYERHLGVIHLRRMENAKASEIHVAQALMAEVLPHLPAGQTLSLDALHTTATTVQTIVTANQHYLLPVKGNRPHTHAALEGIATTVPPQDEATEVDTSHGRSVQRHVQIFPPTPELQAQWPGLTWVGVVHRSGERDQKSFAERVYYLGSAPWTAIDLLHASRQHWQIENELHWVKDVTFEEDYPPRRGGHAPVTWGIFNTFAITLARRQGWRTVPQALRDWANRIHYIFSLLV